MDSEEVESAIRWLVQRWPSPLQIMVRQKKYPLPQNGEWFFQAQLTKQSIFKTLKRIDLVFGVGLREPEKRILRQRWGLDAFIR